MRSPAWPSPGVAWAIVAAITLIGLIPRLIHFDGSLLGDELSTYYQAQNAGFGEVLNRISSDAEISPPLYFLAGWASLHLGDAPELIRLPSLLAYLALVPLIYAVGSRLLSRPAGLVAAAVIALNPFVVFFSTDARAYVVAMALLAATTLVMLIALGDGRRRWWTAYAVLTALCMYTHYTCAFVLAGQLLWLLWAHPQARLSAIAANAGAVILFLPWLPSMLSDFGSPTIDVLSDLQGDGFEIKRDAVETYLFGYQYNLAINLPGRLLVTLGELTIVAGALVGLWRWAGPRIRGAAESWPPVSKGVVLALVLALATPVAELVLLGVGGSDLFGARNLNTATPGVALLIGAIAGGAGPVAGAAFAAVILAIFAYGTARSLDPNISTIDVESGARYIDETADPDDTVLDLISGVLTPVPITPLELYLPEPRSEFRAYLPEGPPPFLSFAPPPGPLAEEAFAAAGGGRLYVIANDPTVDETADPITITLPPADPNRDVTEVVEVPDSLMLVDRRSWEGIADVEVLVFERAAAPGS